MSLLRLVSDKSGSSASAAARLGSAWRGRAPHCQRKHRACRRRRVPSSRRRAPHGRRADSRSCTHAHAHDGCGRSQLSAPHTRPHAHARAHARVGCVGCARDGWAGDEPSRASCGDDAVERARVLRGRQLRRAARERAGRYGRRRARELRRTLRVPLVRELDRRTLPGASAAAPTRAHAWHRHARTRANARAPSGGPLLSHAHARARKAIPSCDGQRCASSAAQRRRQTNKQTNTQTHRTAGRCGRPR
jgi:hypothetical protein